MTLIPICSTNDLPEGSRKTVNVEDTPVLVLHVDGSYYAIEATCPHQSGPLGQGIVLPKLEATFVSAGKGLEESFSETILTISCPWHGWEFDLSTGAHCGDSEVTLSTFEIVEKEGELFLKSP